MFVSGPGGKSVVLLIIAIFLVAAGGYLDMTDRGGPEKRLGPFSKYHLWADGIFLLVLASWVA